MHEQITDQFTPPSAQDRQVRRLVLFLGFDESLKVTARGQQSGGDFRIGRASLKDCLKQLNQSDRFRFRFSVPRHLRPRRRRQRQRRRDGGDQLLTVAVNLTTVQSTEAAQFFHSRRRMPRELQQHLIAHHAPPRDIAPSGFRFTPRCEIP